LPKQQRCFYSRLR